VSVLADLNLSGKKEVAFVKGSVFGAPEAMLKNEIPRRNKAGVKSDAGESLVLLRQNFGDPNVEGP
jgi:hypothetical protein